MQIIGHQVVRLDEVDSTNNYAANLLKETNPPEGTVIMAQNQYAGRGQRGASWETLPGLNLTLSVVLYPKKLQVEDQSLINKAISVAIAQFIQSAITLPVFIKWPNDIFVNDKKVCGILIENTLEGKFIATSVAGIGINVNQRNFETLQYATSLALLTGKDLSYDLLCEQLFSCLDIWYSNLQQGNYDLISNEYLSRLYKLNSWANYKYQGTELTARIIGVTSLGNLLLQKATGEEIICANKEIEWIF